MKKILRIQSRHDSESIKDADKVQILETKDMEEKIVVMRNPGGIYEQMPLIFQQQAIKLM